MQTATSVSAPQVETEPVEASVSGVSWGAVVAGAFVTAALSFSLMALGAGIGLSSMSPWPTAGLSVSQIAAPAILWIILVQASSCAMGGYLAGRLRTKWVSLHTHEVYFRDTAHGFLVWAVGLVISVAFLSSLGLSIAKDTSSAAGQGRDDYYVDTLFRTDHPGVERSDVAFREEARGILTQALRRPEIESNDEAYLTQMVVVRTGLAQAEAQARVKETLASAREALETARKAIAHSLYWLFAALLVGAFCGSLFATFGGRRRDRGWPALKPVGRT